MRIDEEIVKFLASKADRFRLGSCEVDDIIEYADDWKEDWTEEEKDKCRKAGDYFDCHGFGADGKAWYLEEKDSKGLWRTIGFGTAGKPFSGQCSEIVKQLLEKTYIYSCSNGFSDWSSVPKAKSKQELLVKLTAMGM